MSITITNGLPSNVVEIGDEVSQGIVDGLNGASPAASSGNPFATQSNIPAFATTAQAQAGTSATTVVSPLTLLDAKFFQGGKSFPMVTFSTSVVGTGAGSTTAQNHRTVSAPTTAIGYAAFYNFVSNSSRGQSITQSFNWAKRIEFGARLNRNVGTPDANTVFRLSIGKTVSNSGGDLGEKGIMIKQVAGGALQLLVHNGTTLNTTTSSFTPANQQAYDLMVVSDGSGNVTLFVNDVSVATITGGPTTMGGVNSHQIHAISENTDVITGGPMSYQVSDLFFQTNL